MLRRQRQGARVAGARDAPDHTRKRDRLMFDNLDDPLPAPPAPIDAVTARGRRMRRQRRIVAGAVGLFVLAGGIATAAALQGDGHDKVFVTTPSSSTTVVDDTTAPE